MQKPTRKEADDKYKTALMRVRDMLKGGAHVEAVLKFIIAILSEKIGG